MRFYSLAGAATLIFALTVSVWTGADRSPSAPSPTTSNSAVVAPSLPSLDDGVVRSIVPVFGFEEGAAVIESAEWQSVTKTMLSKIEDMSTLPQIAGTTREYYLGFRFADNINDCNSGQGSQWRFYNPWKSRPGHQFNINYTWANPIQGRIDWVKVPSTQEQALAAGVDVTGHPSWGYWTLEARLPQSCIDQGRDEMRVFGIWVMIVDRQNGTAATVNLNTDSAGGSRPAYALGGIGGKMYVQPSGNVSIGTQGTEGYRLSVDGDIRSKEVVVTQNGWADYVFADDYTPMSLPDLRTFIDENRHLPGIPTADEVAEHGARVGETQVQLLAKIEELTLYTLDQQETIDAQRAQLRSQDDRIQALQHAVGTQQKQIDRLLREGQ